MNKTTTNCPTCGCSPCVSICPEADPYAGDQARVCKWMTRFRHDRNPHAIHPFIPGHPLGGQDSYAATIVNHVNRVARRAGRDPG